MSFLFENVNFDYSCFVRVTLMMLLTPVFHKKISKTKLIFILFEEEFYLCRSGISFSKWGFIHAVVTETTPDNVYKWSFKRVDKAEASVSHSSHLICSYNI